MGTHLALFCKKKNQSLKAYCLLYVLPGWIIKNPKVSPPSLFMCPCGSQKKKSIIFLNSNT